MGNVFKFLLERGFVDCITGENLTKDSIAPIKAYVGFDPTSDSLHLGNLVGIIALKWLEKFGHTAVVLLGGATARIGDPSGKSTERPLLSSSEIKKNTLAIEKQVSRLFDKPLILNNENWHSGFFLIDFLRDVGKHFRMGPMLSKESVKSRINSEEGMSFTEFSYQIFQGYDFLHLNKEFGVSVQIGGSDQWGNIIAGIDFARKKSYSNLHGATFPLLTTGDGKKFGKSEKGAIWLDPQKTSPYHFYQHLYAVNDHDVIRLMKMLTFMESSEIKAYEEAFKAGKITPNAAQKKLAEEVTRFVHGEEGLNQALQQTKVSQPGKIQKLDYAAIQELAKNMPIISLPQIDIIGLKFSEIVCKIGLTKSRSEGVRLIENNGAYLNNERITDPHYTIENDCILGGEYLLLGSGKKKKILVKIEKEFD